MLLHRRRMVVSEMTRKPFCHLHLTFDLINLGSIFDHDFLGKYMFQGRLVVAGIRTTVPLEWDQLWLPSSDFLHSPPFFLLMCTST